ncbi:uncharacterized MFS-type transporter C09D4.1 [Tribolium castaneum]|uniref:uncharacterized MFS-type transporter C09D4.1 n=1 Tax=Tribolium castaneum TaxID=7070 RepID=UPI0000D575C8|nr:PREDICTED: uncharacterized MFS-type transporter C09D4.1 [Tribolium castaneum]|eukprot:XP_015837552.1 PREDICTED: uncharacterized MFS-type transporter C09D4.1 [Tribolium castaneum]
MEHDIVIEKFLPTENRNQEIVLYKKRWLILTLYILYAAINAFQWFEYSIIANVLMKFYNVSAVSVDWTSIIYMALYMPMVIPVSYLMEKLDLRQIAAIGVLGTALGTIVKVYSLSPDQMWVTYLGQTILSSMQVFILPLPPRIASVWFGSKEVSLACALGVFGTQLGQAIGFVVPPIVVRYSEDVETIGRDLGVLVKGLAWLTLVVTVAVLTYFSAHPTTPPNDINNERTHFFKSLKNLFRNRSFNFHTVAYGINIAVFTSISTLLNQFFLFHFPKSEEDAGRVGLIMVILGMMGAIAFGYILDKTHRYKEITLCMYIASFLSVIAFMFSLESGSKILVYISGALVGLFINAYMPVGLELAIELTYPEPESTSSGILISMTQTLGVLFTLMLGSLFSNFGSFWALATMACCLFVGSVLTAFITNVKKRQNALKR